MEFDSSRISYTNESLCASLWLFLGLFAILGFYNMATMTLLSNKVKHCF